MKLSLVNQSKRTVQWNPTKCRCSTEYRNNRELDPEADLKAVLDLSDLKAELKHAGKAVLELNLPESSTSICMKAIKAPTRSNHMQLYESGKLSTLLLSTRYQPSNL